MSFRFSLLFLLVSSLLPSELGLCCFLLPCYHYIFSSAFRRLPSCFISPSIAPTQTTLHHSHPQSLSLPLGLFSYFTQKPLGFLQGQCSKCTPRITNSQSPSNMCQVFISHICLFKCTPAGNPAPSMSQCVFPGHCIQS